MYRKGATTTSTLSARSPALRPATRASTEALVPCLPVAAHDEPPVALCHHAQGRGASRGRHRCARAERARAAGRTGEERRVGASERRHDEVRRGSDRGARNENVTRSSRSVCHAYYFPPASLATSLRKISPGASSSSRLSFRARNSGSDRTRLVDLLPLSFHQPCLCFVADRLPARTSRDATCSVFPRIDRSLDVRLPRRVHPRRGAPRPARRPGAPSPPRSARRRLAIPKPRAEPPSWTAAAPCWARR